MTHLEADGTAVPIPTTGTDSLWDVLAGGGVAVPFGCGTGHCGACTVLLDGAPTPACLVPKGSAVSAAVQTARTAALSDLVDAMATTGAVQCGFCSPGMVVTLSWAIRSAVAQRRCLTDEEIRELLVGHLCRCTGYAAVVQAAGAACRKLLAAQRNCGA